MIEDIDLHELVRPDEVARGFYIPLRRCRIAARVCISKIADAAAMTATCGAVVTFRAHSGADGSLSKSIQVGLPPAGWDFEQALLLLPLDSIRERGQSTPEVGGSAFSNLGHQTGEASHDLSRFLCFGKEGQLRGREFEDQLHTFSCLAILHNAVIAWNMRHIAQVVERQRAEGQPISDADLALTSPLVRRHINPYGRYHFDLTKFKRGLE